MIFWIVQWLFNASVFVKTAKKNANIKIKLGLTKMTKKCLTPPPISTDVERLFTTAGDILSNERNRLVPENLEKPLFCRENLPVVDCVINHFY